MTTSAYDIRPNYVELTVDIVTAFVSKNSVPVSALADLLSNVHAAISGLSKNESGLSNEYNAKKLTSAQIRKSITLEGLISFEDGKLYKTLKRHLKLHGLSPNTYRQKFGLPDDYPMVSPNYSARRSELARSMGLGLQRRKRVPAASDKTVTNKVALALKEPKKVGRPRKAVATA